MKDIIFTRIFAHAMKAKLFVRNGTALRYIEILVKVLYIYFMYYNIPSILSYLQV